MGDQILAQQNPTATALPGASDVVAATIDMRGPRRDCYITIKNTHASNALGWKIQRRTGPAGDLVMVEEPVVGAESPSAFAAGYNSLAAGTVTDWRVSGARPDDIRVIARAADGAASQITVAYKVIG